MLPRPSLAIPFLLIASPTTAITLNVPGDEPTIEAALAAAVAGDSVVVECGTYHEASLTIAAPIVLCGAPGDPGCVTIDGGGARILVADGLDATTIVEGIRFVGGAGTYGGAVSCTDSRLTFRNCRFEGCSADWGGAVALHASLDPMGATLDGCTFVGNDATFRGGAVWVGGPVALVRDCVFAGNRAASAAAIWAEGSGVKIAIEGSTFFSSRTLTAGEGAIEVESGIVSIDRSIVAFGEQARAVKCTMGASALVSCTDVFGNELGDWVDCLAGLDGVNGNFSADPLFCDAVAGDLSVDGASPCLPGNHPGGAVCNTIGALGEGCSVVAAPSSMRLGSLGLLKAAYRE